MRRLSQSLAAIGLLACLAATSFAANWTGGSIDLDWELSPPSTAAKGEEFDATAACNYNANMAAGKEWEYGSPSISFEWQYPPDGSAVGAGSDTGTGGSGGGFSYKSQRTVVYNTASAAVDDKTVKVRAHVTGTIVDYGPDDEKGTGDDVIYTIDQWSAWIEASLSIYEIAINHCPAYFVPGHDNDVKYQIYPNGYTGTYGNFEIYKRDANGNPTGNAVYSSTNLDKAGDAERTFTYSGTDVNYTDKEYVVIISIGQDETNCSSDTAPFDVVGYNISILAWDYLSNDFCDGVDVSTVTSDTVKIRVKAFDDASYSEAFAITAFEVPDTQDYAWYYDRGGVEMAFNYVFYVMTEQEQYYYLRYEVEEGGILDFGENMYDQDHSTEAYENGYIWKFRINAQGELVDIDNPVELTRQ